MPLLVGDVIEAARDRHPAFDRRRHPDPVCVRFLDGWQRELVADALVRNSSYLAADAEVSLPLQDFAAGHPIDFAYQFIHGGTVYAGASRTKFHLLPWAHRIDPGPYYAGWIHGDRLFLRGRATDWTGVEKIVLSYAPVAAELATLTQELTIGEKGRSAAVEALAAFMAKRGHTDPTLPPIVLEVFLGDADRARERFLADVGNQRRAQTVRVREVW